MSDDPQARIEQLETRVARLESELAQLRAPAVARTTPAPAREPDQQPTTTPSWNAPPQAPPPWAAPAAPVARAERAPFALDTEQALKWGGVGLVVLAVGFAVSTAISRGWVGPGLQLAGAVAISVALVATGLRLRPTRPGWTHALCAGGVLALFTTAASDLFVDETTTAIAFVSTAVASMVGWALTRHVLSQWVGAATLLGGLTGWFVIGDGDPPVAISLAFTTATIAITIALALRHTWFGLRFAAHGAALVAVAAVVEASDRTIEHILVLTAAALLIASLVRIPSIGDLRSVWQQIEVQMVAVTAPWAFGVVAVTADLDADETVGATAILVAAGAAAIAFALRHRNHRAHGVSILIGASVTLSIGLAILLSAAVAFTAIAVQGAGLVVLARVLGDNVRVLVNAAVVWVVAAGFALGEMLAAWDDDAAVGDDVAHAAIIVAGAFGIWQTRRDIIHRIGALVVLGLTLVWTGSVLVHLPQGQAAVSVSWAVIGTAVLVAGAIRRRPDVAAVGLAVLGLTVAKLLTVDLREVDALWRAGLFLVIGLGFLRLGFLLPRLTSPVIIEAEDRTWPDS